MSHGSDGIDRRSILQTLGAGVGLAAGCSGLASAGALSTPGSEGPTPLEMAAARTRSTAVQREAIAAKAECTTNEREIFGPTDINAQSGNGRLSVALNGEGTMTVFRWPRPTFYDQIKYYTLGRNDDDEIQVLPNEGAFLGLAVKGPDDDAFETTWLREMTVSSQYYANDSDDTDATYSDEVVTKFTDGSGVAVTVRDLTAAEEDAFVRHVRVTGLATDAEAKLVAFENFNLVVSKHPQFPIHDWCTEENNQDRARYVDEVDAIVHTLSGIDESTGESQSVAVAMAFRGESAGHQVGGDAYEPAAEPTGEAGPTTDAYDDAATLPLTGNDEYVGQTTGALVGDLDPTGGHATASVIFTADHSPAGAGEILGTIRARLADHGFTRDLRSSKERWFDARISGAPLPDTPNTAAGNAIHKLSRRALITMVTDTENHPAPPGAEREKNRAIVASISTQGPYGEDWPRDGAFFNHALSVAGLDDWVKDRGRWYAEIQQREDDPRPSHPNTPPGNWAMVYYGDGVAGGPIPYEIDETGYAVWTMWDHYQATKSGGDDFGDVRYLIDVYPAIKRAGDFLVRCRNPETGLHCRTSWEDDNYFNFTPSIVGASIAWLGLKSAKEAAAELGHPADRARFEARQHELGRAIDEHLWDDGMGGYGARERFAMPEVVWPVQFTPYADGDEIKDEPQVDDPIDHPRIQSHLDAVWDSVEVSFHDPQTLVQNGHTTGQYEAKGLLSLAMTDWTGNDTETPVDVGRGLEWIATRHATDDTHVMGEAWQIFDGADGNPEIRSIISQPHAWEQVLTYLAALAEYGPE